MFTHASLRLNTATLSLFKTWAGNRFQTLMLRQTKAFKRQFDCFLSQPTLVSNRQKKRRRYSGSNRPHLLLHVATCHYLPPQNSGPCNSFYCLGHFKNVYDDDDDDVAWCWWTFWLCIGLMMLLDIPYERALSHADVRWGDDTQCNFPLFSWLSPLPLKWMYAVYWIMIAGIVLEVLVAVVQSI